jgi:hypothetical protein
MLSLLQSLTLLLKKSLIWIAKCVKRLVTSSQKTTTQPLGSFQSIKVIYIKKGQLPSDDWHEERFIHSYHHDAGGYAMAVKYDKRKS